MDIRHGYIAQRQSSLNGRKKEFLCRIRGGGVKENEEDGVTKWKYEGGLLLNLLPEGRG